MHLKYNILYFCKKAAEMTAKLIRYVVLSPGNNCLEGLENFENLGISFFQIFKHPEWT